MNRPVPVAGPDVLLRAVEAAGRDAAASLLALEEHAGLRFLRTTPLTGESARRRDAVVATVAAMHADLARHRDVVARARAARGPRARPSTAEATAVLELLRGPSVLVEEAVPAPRRGPADGPVVARRLTPATLLARVRAANATVWTEAARAVAVWEAVAAALDPLDAALDEARDALAALTVTARDDGLAARRAAVQDAREAVTATRRAVLTDLLVHDPRRPVDPAVLAALAERARALRDDAAGAVLARDDRPARRRRLAEALDALEAEEAAVHAVAARVAREIAGEHHGAPPARADALRALPDGIEAELDAVESEVAAAAHTARRARAEREGLLERRDELAGRLTALAAQASATGRAADPRVVARRREARDRLAAVPCDLAAATVAVRAYRRALEGAEDFGDEVVAGARPSDEADPGHRRVDRAQPGPRV
jgi:hypothetical protein